MELLRKIPTQSQTIKLLGDMGETRRAVQLAERNMNGPYPDIAALYAADACQVAGDFPAALKYYEFVLSVPAAGKRVDRIKRNHQTARAGSEAIRLFEMLDVSKVPDGTYQSNSPGYAGPIHVEVSVAAGRITSLDVEPVRAASGCFLIADDLDCFCAIAHLPPGIIAWLRDSTPADPLTRISRRCHSYALS